MLVFTSCAANYLPKARVLAQSVKQFHPHWRFYLLLGETAAPRLDASLEPFDKIITLEDINIPQYRAWMFQYNLVELCTAIKGAALYHFLHDDNEDKIIYLDPDILVLNSLITLENELDEHDILLTPHQLDPRKSQRDILSDEICALGHGVFNLGFFGCRNSGQGRAFSKFWWRRLEKWCRDDKLNGLFTDQKWCDLAPAYFPTLGIVRDPGCNVASWNLAERKIARDNDGVFCANGSPIKFYHFTGHDSGDGLENTSRFSQFMPAVRELWSLYGKRIRENEQEALGKMPWSGGFFTNGQQITLSARHYYRDNPELQLRYPDPFQTDANGQTGYAGYWHDYQASENKGFDPIKKGKRLCKLTAAYLNKNGGLRGLPKLAKRCWNIWRNKGLRGLCNQIEAFKNKAELNSPSVGISDLMNGKNTLLADMRTKIARAFHDGKGTLVIDHQYGGGANEYRKGRVRAFLDNDRPCLLLTWDMYANQAVFTFYFTDGGTLAARGRDLGNIFDYPEIRFGHILLNELVNWSAPSFANPYAALPSLIEQILELKKRDGAFLEIPIHDFYCICPSYTLLENGRSYCGLPADAARCGKCVKNLPLADKYAPDVEQWRDSWRQMLAAADEIRVFSRSSRDILREKYDLAPAKFRLYPHLPLEKLEEVPAPRPEQPLCIGVLGNIARHKGADIVKEMIDLMNPDEKLVVIGEIDAALPAKIRITGPYARKDLASLCQQNGVTCILIPSIWPETFCYTAQEAMQLNLPLVVFPLGAQAERARNYEKGLAAETISAQAALDAVRQLDRLRKNRKHA